jgi:hypothetical protein
MEIPHTMRGANQARTRMTMRAVPIVHHDYLAGEILSAD